jgi:hypothetical protein
MLLFTAAFARLPRLVALMYGAWMNTHDNAEDDKDNLSEELRDLAMLHPTYSNLELKEARAQLYRYFDLAWRIFVRLEREGKLDALNLTGKPVNLKLNSESLDPPFKHVPPP